MMPETPPEGTKSRLNPENLPESRQNPAKPGDVPVITRKHQEDLGPLLEKAMAYNPDVADLIMAAYRLGRCH